MSKIFDETNGIWLVDETTKGYHLFDAKLAKSLSLLFSGGDTVVDFGCGLGDYVNYFIDKHILCFGFDGNPNTEKLTNGLCSQIDLSKDINLKPYEDIELNRLPDWVLSLEVGEHIPKEFEDVFIGNLHRNNTKGIVLSWGIEGQGGTGHVNERNNDYIIEKIEKLGYKYNKPVSDLLRSEVDLWYFENTLMVFNKL